MTGTVAESAAASFHQAALSSMTRSSNSTPAAARSRLARWLVGHSRSV
jgi:hypothetical protein